MDKRRLRTQARLDGVRSIAERTGKKVEVSEMELIALCNMANLGLYSMFARMDGKHGDSAAKDLEEMVSAARSHFGQGTSMDGLSKLCETIAALLEGDRFGKYTIGR